LAAPKGKPQVATADIQELQTNETFQDAEFILKDKDGKEIKPFVKDGESYYRIDSSKGGKLISVDGIYINTLEDGQKISTTDGTVEDKATS